jgi:hypothetical protein
MMASIVDAVKVVADAPTQEPTQDLTQFEPDPDADGGTDRQAAASDDGPADPQWVVFADPERESDWALSELEQIGAGWKT